MDLVHAIRLRRCQQGPLGLVPVFFGRSARAPSVQPVLVCQLFDGFPAELSGCRAVARLIRDRLILDRARQLVHYCPSAPIFSHFPCSCLTPCIRVLYSTPLSVHASPRSRRRPPGFIKISAIYRVPIIPPS